MTAEQFRALALALEGATEGVHFGKPDFRANGRVFASLGEARGMVALPPPEQEMRLEAAPEVFSPCAGAWGRNGCTYVQPGGRRRAHGRRRAPRRPRRGLRQAEGAQPVGSKTPYGRRARQRLLLSNSTPCGWERAFHLMEAMTG